MFPLDSIWAKNRKKDKGGINPTILLNELFVSSMASNLVRSCSFNLASPREGNDGFFSSI